MSYSGSGVQKCLKSIKTIWVPYKKYFFCNPVLLMFEVIRDGKQITMIWVPSHMGIHGNEMADHLAKEAIRHPEIEFNIPAEMSDLKCIIPKEIMNEWQTRWNSVPESRHYWSLESRVTGRIKFAISYRKKVIITKLRLGKCRLNHNLKSMGLHETGLCETCGTDETIEHWL